MPAVVTTTFPSREQHSPPFLEKKKSCACKRAARSIAFETHAYIQNERLHSPNILGESAVFEIVRKNAGRVVLI